MVRILDSTDVDGLLEPATVLGWIRQLFEISADSTAVGYGRIDLAHPNGWLRTLPGFIGPLGVFGFKTLNRAQGVGMRYAIYVHDLETGGLVGIVDGRQVTNIRTGVVSALATDYLAPTQVDTATIVGTGQVGRGQVVALDLVRPASTLMVYARTPEKRRRFIEEMTGAVRSELVEATSVEEAVDGSQLITLATNATEPVLRLAHLPAAGHVNSVGPASRDRFELSSETFHRFDRVVCDSVDLVFDEAGDARAAAASGEVDPAIADDLSALVTGVRPGRSAPEELTLFKSVGTGLQDLMVAGRLLEAAAASNTGVTVPDFESVKAFDHR